MSVCHVWNDAQDDFLRTNARAHPVPVLVEMMRAEFDITRTYESIAKRKNQLGILETERTWFSSRQVAQLLGVGPTWLLGIRRANLIPTVPANRKSRPDVGIYPADLEEFVRREHLRFTPERMPRNRYRSIVEVEYRTGRYLDVNQVARALGVGSWRAHVVGLYQSGAIPAVFLSSAGRTGGPRWVAKQADVLAYLARRDQVAA